MYTQQPPKNPTLAAILSFIIAGLGQIYNGEVVKGIIIIVVQIINVLLMGIFIGFITWPVVWIWSIYDAHKVAKRINEEAAQQAVATTKVCPQCAERVNSGAKVCHFCGYQFVPAETPEGAGPLALPEAPVFPATSPQEPALAVPASVATAAPAPAAPTAVKYCPQCGARADAAANFCLQCGTRFETAPAAPVVAAPAATAAPPAAASASEEVVAASWMPEPMWAGATPPDLATASDGADVLSDPATTAETVAYYEDSPPDSEAAGVLVSLETPDELS